MRSRTFIRCFYCRFETIGKGPSVPYAVFPIGAELIYAIMKFTIPLSLSIRPFTQIVGTFLQSYGSMVPIF